MKTQMNRKEKNVLQIGIKSVNASKDTKIFKVTTGN